MSRIERTESVGDSLCPVCHEQSEIYAIGQCDHPICYRCSTRMRVLCSQMYCPICRGDLPQVVFLTDKKKYEDVNRRNCIPNRKFKILLEDESVEEAYEALLEHKCRTCDEGPLFDTFQQLQAHMRKNHMVFACDLCLAHLMIFSFERRFYNRKDLAVHRRSGDADNRSYRGHPLCRFCDERYFDNDELHRHLRKDHFYCHFCDANSNEFYSDYEDLRHHFQSKHFLCQEGNCASPQARFTHAFGSEIDLKAHIAAEHMGNKSKAQVKELRTLDINFQYAPRRRGRDAAGISADDYEDLNQAGRGQRRHRNREEARNESRSASDTQPAHQDQNVNSTPRVPALDDFPTLGGQVPPVTQAPPPKKLAEEEDFPALSSKRCVAPVAVVTTAHVARGTAARSQQLHSTTTASHKPTSFSNVIISTAAAIDSGRPKSIDMHPALKQPAPTYAAQQNTWAAPRLASGEDFPTLGGEKKSKSKGDGPNYVSLGVWSRKTKDGTSSGRTSSGVSSGKQSAVVTKPTSLAALGRSLCDDGEFPSLGGARPVQSAGWVEKKTSPSSASKNSKVASSSSKNNFSPPTDSQVALNGNRDEKTEETRVKKKKKKQKEGKKTESPAKEDDRNTKNSDQAAIYTVHDKNGVSKAQAADIVDTGISLSVLPSRENMIDEEKKETASAVISKETVTKTVLETVKDSEPFQVVSSKGNKKWQTNTVSKQFSEEDFPALTSKKAASVVTPVSQPPQTVPTVLVVNTGEEKENKRQQKGSGFKSLREEDFPVLQAVQKTAPPPGFKNAAKVSAPPGLNKPASSQTRAPPGLSSPASAISDSTAAIPMAVKLNMYSYVLPADSGNRNKELVSKVRRLLILKDDGFDQFRILSGEFRSNQVSAAEYYQKCKELFGGEKFEEILPELVALLPDILKQHELVQAHKQDKCGVSSPLSLTTCPTCLQMLQMSDSAAHLTGHPNLTSDMAFLKELAATRITT